MLVPHLEALALPDIVERATPKAHADMHIVIPQPLETKATVVSGKGMRINTSRGHLCCLVLDNIYGNLQDFQVSKTRRLKTPFLYVVTLVFPP